jgi:phosphatidylserine decarboxylase
MKGDVKRNISPHDWKIKASLHIQPRFCSVAILSTSLVPWLFMDAGPASFRV